MIRLFFLLSAVAVLMIVIAGASVYWLGTTQIAQTRQESAETVAKSVALGITAQINLLTDMLQKMAQDPEVLAAIASSDTSQLALASTKLEKYLPGILKIRLFLPGISELDDKTVPKMGYADLDMVRQTFTKNQLPTIQGDVGPDRHLAIARRIMNNDQVIGVILASLNFDFIAKSLQSQDLKGEYLELRQGTSLLGSVGDPTGTVQNEEANIPVANTGWALHYQQASATIFSGFMVIAGLIAISALLAMLTFFIGYRRLANLLRHDLSTILKAYKDMMTNKLQGTYPVLLPEMNAVVSTLVQYKRVLDNQDSTVANDSESDFVDMEMSGFFDDFADSVTAGGTTGWMSEAALKSDNDSDFAEYTVNNSGTEHVQPVSISKKRS